MPQHSVLLELTESTVLSLITKVLNFMLSHKLSFEKETKFEFQQ
jgi:hypothetical protein